MNFSVHLPDPLLTQLDQFAAAQAKSRSSIVREAVSEYIATRTASTWPSDMAAWMKTKPAKGTNKTNAPASNDDWPDFNAIRKQSNDSANKRVANK
jgi:predicted transcriptional regulator